MCVPVPAGGVRAVSSDADLPGKLRESLEQLSSLPTADLEKVAQDHLSERLSAELEALNFKAKSEGLTSSEEERRETLLEGYEKVMLLRAEAALVLKTRGLDASSLLGS